MSKPIPPVSEKGKTLKASALQKLHQARALIDSARSDLCNLEGTGYCDHYDDAYTLYEKVGKFTDTLSRLAPPTGVFDPNA